MTKTVVVSETVADTAACLLDRLGPVTPHRLHKLLYYTQAWHLAWEGEAFFPDRIEAWPPGPVLPDLYAQHRGLFTLTEWPTGDASRLCGKQAETVDAILTAYGPLTSKQLVHMVCGERPWRMAREGLNPTEVGCAEITVKSMRDYYASLDRAEDAISVTEIEWETR